MSSLDERVIQEMERLLQRQLTPEEVRLLLFASLIEKDLIENEIDLPLAA